jgi:hypothetical protein
MHRDFVSALYKLNYQLEASATLDAEKELSKYSGVAVMWVLSRSVRSGSSPSETYRNLAVQLAA